MTKVSAFRDFGYYYIGILFFICIDFCDSLAYLPNKVGKVKSGMKNCSSRLLVNGMVAQIMP